MTRSVLTMDLKDDPAVIAAYRDHHKRVWPEVLQSLRRAGIRQMEIYLLERRLVMVVETDGIDFRHAFAAHVSSHPRVAEWESLMKSMQAPPPGGSDGGWWTEMQPIFQLEVVDEPITETAPRR
ncbi:MAG: hypothetical protein A3H96_26930 [Acidobacteria bacterium RIFCSPLOWO2_02_FULL_67_36]|nr:MAG: hypothetical protein A3H96_26930 [Acidobacteria bacterium RIFCSPLOWO2_02_FULL_67_36]OFW24845.1 MAG: hypothetical protein A3G21_12725 [Acidobacteria bacterium RIFCSPLOWO2_12_FULL_66_21]